MSINGQYEQPLFWGGVGYYESQVKELSKDGDKFVILFNTGVRIAYTGSKNDGASVYSDFDAYGKKENKKMVVSEFDDIEGLTIEGTDNRDLIRVRDCSIDSIDISGDKKAKDFLYVRDCTDGAIHTDQKDIVNIWSSNAPDVYRDGERDFLMFKNDPYK